ncbi:MAG TPA: SurA N-terminal domain-containing protein [Anaeromyxobacteraceae bacterium]|nr:SurA N-terminal domain-containing protein [Anaeromyxobacteraceae bacterium]
MLDVLRANKNSVLTWVILVAIAVVFVVSFGPGTRGFTDRNVQAASYAAKVDGNTVTAAEFEQAYAQLFRLYQQRAGNALTRELADQLGLRSMAMNQLVERELVLTEAARHGLRVSDEEVSRTVHEMPGFKNAGGEFDFELYRRITSNSYGSPGKFEERLRQDLVSQRMLALVRQGVKVPEEEVRQAWLSDADKANLVMVRFPFASFRPEVKVSEAEAKSFLARNAARVEQFYKDNAARYHRPKRVHARHILVRVDEQGGAEADQAARQKVDALAARLAGGEDFGTLASAVSDDPGSKDRGGDLGFFGPGTMAKPFEDAAFALQPGQVSPPVRTRFGWHLVKVEAVQAAEEQPLAQVQEAIARELAEGEAAKALALKRAQAALAAARAGKALGALFPPPGQADAGKKEPRKGPAIAAEETGPFTPSGDFVPRAGAMPGLAADAARADAGQLLPKVYQSSEAALVAQVKERSRPDPARYPEARQQVQRRLRARREAEVEGAWVKALRQRATVKVNEAFLRGDLALPSVDLE